MKNILKNINKNLLLLRTDRIGDYVLFRNFIETLKKSNKYRDYKITLLGNPVFKDLAEKLDSEYVEEFIWLDNRHYAYNPLYRNFINNKLNQKNFDTIINPVFSRVYKITDKLVKALNAREKIGSAGDLTNITAAQQVIGNSFYTKLLPAQNDAIFEFLRNKEFFENLLEEKIELQKPYISVKNHNPKVKLPQNKYAAICPGAAESFRQWDTNNFAQICDHLAQDFGLDVVICGSKNDKKLARSIKKASKADEILDLTGKTDLMGLAYVLKNSEIIVSGDTSFYHIAASVGSKGVCLSNGNTLGRFVPYPEEIYSEIITVFIPEISENLKSLNNLIQKYKYASTQDINLITSETVKNAIETILK